MTSLTGSRLVLLYSDGISTPASNIEVVEMSCKASAAVHMCSTGQSQALCCGCNLLCNGHVQLIRFSFVSQMHMYNMQNA